MKMLCVFEIWNYSHYAVKGRRLSSSKHARLLWMCVEEIKIMIIIAIIWKKILKFRLRVLVIIVFFLNFHDFFLLSHSVYRLQQFGSKWWIFRRWLCSTFYFLVKAIWLIDRLENVQKRELVAFDAHETLKYLYSSTLCSSRTWKLWDPSRRLNLVVESTERDIERKWMGMKRA